MSFKLFMLGKARKETIVSIGGKIMANLSQQRREQMLSFLETLKEQHNPCDLWTDIKTTGMDAEGGVSFKNGKKPIKLLKRLLSLSTSTPKIILDFFAGSGSTAQAVLELNKEDGKDRKFILCTNNEGNICNEITYPRIKTVITGVKVDGTSYSEGLAYNLKYYKTDFVDKKSEDIYEDLLAHIKEMIQLEYGVKVDNSKYVMIMDDEEMDDFEDKNNG